MYQINWLQDPIHQLSCMMFDAFVLYPFGLLYCSNLKKVGPILNQNPRDQENRATYIGN